MSQKLKKTSSAYNREMRKMSRAQLSDIASQLTSKRNSFVKLNQDLESHLENIYQAKRGSQFLPAQKFFRTGEINVPGNTMTGTYTRARALSRSESVGSRASGRDKKSVKRKSDSNSISSRSSSCNGFKKSGKSLKINNIENQTFTKNIINLETFEKNEHLNI